MGGHCNTCTRNMVFWGEKEMLEEEKESVFGKLLLKHACIVTNSTYYCQVQHWLSPHTVAGF